MINSSGRDATKKFMMGEFEAEFPLGFQYANNHMWVITSPDDATLIRFGFAAYAVRLLQDVYFLDWLIDAPSRILESQEIGSIESKKAESALYAPCEGELVRFNAELMEDPSAINVDKYGEGWLFEMQKSDTVFLNVDQYVDLLDSVWAKTQRTIKGQVNE
jgi:glycine cleavage system H protein